GEQIAIASKTCENITESFIQIDGGVSAVDTRGKCAVLYAAVACDGNHVIMRPGTESHGNLGEIGFNDRSRSIGPCVFQEEDEDQST
ncbi:hypothetical protein PFISCL1PPCAC_3035, partial [Pristionchus fissidentatus]